MAGEMRSESGRLMCGGGVRIIFATRDMSWSCSFVVLPTWYSKGLLLMAARFQLSRERVVSWDGFAAAVAAVAAVNRARVVVARVRRRRVMVCGCGGVL